MSDTLQIDYTQYGGTAYRLGNGEEYWNFGYAQGLAMGEEATQLRAIELIQEHPAKWEDVFLSDGMDSDEDIFLWDAEKAVYGDLMDAWDQSSIGSCVSFGWGRGANDLLVNQMSDGIIEVFKETVATEPIYGGSRVEVGKGRLGSDDGSLGSWAAEWMLKWGVLLRKVYGQHDLTKYSVSRCREYGVRGCPDEIEPEAKQHPIQSVALVSSFDQAWQAIGTRSVIPICSNVGFDSPLQGGFCKRNANWGHCMVLRGRFRAKNGKRAMPCTNSWADYLRSKGNPESIVETYSGKKIQLPTGTFCIYEDDVDTILRQRDSYAISKAKGFKERNRYRW